MKLRIIEVENPSSLSNIFSLKILHALPHRENAGDVCGANDCGNIPKIVGNETDTFEKPAMNLVYSMLGIYLATGTAAVILVIALLDRLTGAQSRKKDSISGVSLLFATLRHLADKRQLLLLPLTFFSGLEQAFIFGDYTKV